MAEPRGDAASGALHPANLVRVVVDDRYDALGLMHQLARYRSFLVQPDAGHWIVHARCGDDEVGEVCELLEAARDENADFSVAPSRRGVLQGP